MSELRRCLLAPWLLSIYRWQRFRWLSLGVIRRLEGSDFYSATLRDILDKYHGVRVGAYSYGECMIPGSFPPGVTVGRYVSVASDVRVFLRNHPFERLSLHPFFYNSHLGWLKEDSVSSGSLNIGHDSWLGERAIITPSCKHIGIGAVVGAGSVVTKDVPEFGIVAGNPARLIRYRFPEELRELIKASRWWEKSVDECALFIRHMTEPLLATSLHHPLLTNWSSTGAKQDSEETPLMS